MSSPARRRILFASLVAATSLCMIGIVQNQFTTNGLTWAETALLAFYGLLLTWIGAGFWLFTIGAVSSLWTKPKAFVPQGRLPPDTPRTAIVIPIYHEDIKGVFDRLRVIYRSLERTGNLALFEFFVLSDSQDEDTGRAEVRAWQDAGRDLDAAGRLFYRRRLDNRGRKSGNIEEFCRRWGGRYTYMVVLDADSLMSGDALTTMVARMEADPGMALLQTWPVSVGGRSLFSRVQQFAKSVYGQMFVAGLNWVQMGAGTYWGHNAIIRVRAFAESCALPLLPGAKPLGGEILSHDFVEAALLVKTGWRVCLAPDLPGSYEEGASNLIEHARRDRRWCQGNLQHWRLLFARGLHVMSRMTFLIGIMSYLSGPLWLIFLALSIFTFPEELERWFQMTAARSQLPGIIVLVATLTLLIGPKLLALVIALARSKIRRKHGGAIPLVFGVVGETILSALIAPLFAVLHTRFIFSILSGQDSGWGPPTRGTSEIGWRTAFASHSVEIAVGLGLATLSIVVAPELFWWFLPITLPLMLSVPVTVLTSRRGLGQRLQRWGFLLTPDEVNPTREVRELTEISKTTPPLTPRSPEHAAPGDAQHRLRPLNNLHPRGLQS